MSLKKDAKNTPQNIERPRIYRVIVDYQAQYADPISFTSGELLQVSDRTENWRDNSAWLWIRCTDPRGKNGWVPQNAVDTPVAKKTGIARYDYSATELTITVGEELLGAQAESGWLWCTDQHGNKGWIPADHVIEI
ncbi:MAG TPA: SH3 domain-containing protein [Ktedonobacteraceae bacterium]|nr:SH3 domain-containing protein [Ktedonobacteraceae bacterium]